MSMAQKSMSLLKRDVFLFCTTIVTGVVVARKLGPEAMGIWTILQMVPSYAECFGRLKFDMAAVYYLGKRKYELGEMVFNLNLLAVGMSAVILGLIALKYDWVYGHLFGKSDVDVRGLMAIMMVQIPAQFLYMNYSYLFIYKEDVVAYNRMVVIKALFSSVVGIVLLVVFDLGLVAVVAASVLSIFIATIYGAVTFGRQPGAHKAVNLSAIKDLLGYGFKLYIAGIIGQLNTYVAQLLVVLYLTPAAVAYFSMAQSRGQLLDRIPSSLNTILFPRVSKADDESVSASLVAKSFRVTLVILGIVAVVAAICIKPLVLVLYGSDYLPMLAPFLIMLPGLAVAGAATVFNQYFMGVGRADITAKIAVAPLVLQVLAAVVLIPRLGVVGAAMAFVFSFVAVAFLQIAVYLRMSSSCVADVLPGWEDVGVVGRFIAGQFARMKIFRGRCAQKGMTP